MSREINDHRLGAFVYGFLSGLGLILIMWGVASISWMPSRYSTIFVGIILFGVFLLSVGSCREAYLRGSLSSQPSTRENTQPKHQKTTYSNPKLKGEIREQGLEAETREVVIYEQERQVQT